MCYTEGILQAYIDGELDGEQLREVDYHLQQCAMCRQKVEELKAIDSFISLKMRAYINADPQTNGSSTWHEIKKTKGDNGMSKNSSGFFNRSRRMIAVAAACLALIATFSFPGVRSMAGEFLTIFRVERVQTITIDPRDMQQIELALREGASQVDVKNFGNVEVAEKIETTSVSAAEAAEAVDFELKLPKIKQYGDPELQKTSGSTMTMTLNVGNVNKLLQALNSTKLLPEDLDGKTFTLSMPAAIIATYNTGGDKIIVAQSRSPELKAPNGIDVLAVRDALLSIPALPASIKNQLEAINDWQHTVLIPNVNGTSKEVMVNGNQGVFIDSASGNSEAKFKTLVWNNNGVVYTIMGNNITAESAIAMAEQMK
ncbi:Putative zinc-finger [Desulfotomaculum arcticum]|uniref:Anti-sigma-W factor RsiW n=1 Tax=Desulfotruncus arcticus DSM 17038 TaxID=1121424 RepID=A0A1I2N7K6_9FIRM|nr:DUF4367 domain-containing protein [Desulfotruncus arcticus]SFF98849.1 Putative zinc-finger [Desulfotomaculum arcticum] [Desulfotruncus arcticus DSM 17038]